jgi:cell division septation protein DedD
MITEQDIQQAFFAHLKEFYRYRYEYIPGSFMTQQNALATGGIIADGMVQFTKPDGSTFLGTFEATSFDRASEVKFQRNALYFLWDCIAFASVSSAAIILYYYTYQSQELGRLGIAGIVGFILIALLFTFSLWYFTMGSWRKYRYIYAIEQFRQYFADEQWVVLGDDVFAHSEDPYMNELRLQCTYRGFGLATVNDQGAVRVLSTPSRLGIYGTDRADAHWLTGSTAYVQLRSSWEKLPVHAGPLTTLWNAIIRPINFLIFKPLQHFLKRISGVQDSEFTRFMRSFVYQKAATGFGLVLLTVFCVQAIKQERLKSDAEIDTRASFFQRTNQKGYSNPEDEAGYLDKNPLPITYGKGVTKQYPELKIEQQGRAASVSPSTNARSTTSSPTNGIESDAPVQEIDLTSLRKQEEAETAPKIESPKPIEPAMASTTTAKGVKPSNAATTKAKPDACSNLSGKTGWLVQDNYFASAEGADLRMKELKNAKFDCFTVKATCVNSDKAGYYVFLKDLFASEEQAIQYLQTVVPKLKKAKMDTGRTIIKAIKD